MSTNSNPNQGVDSNLPDDRPSTPRPVARSRSSAGKSRRPTRIEIVDRQPPPTDDLWLRFKQHLHTFCGTVLSLLLHLTLLVFLALFVFSQRQKVGPGLAAEFVSPPDEQVLVEVEQPDVTIKVDPIDSDSPLDQLANDQALDSDITSPDIEFSQEQHSQPSEPLAPLVETNPVSPEATIAVGGGLQGRSADARGAMAARYGGTPESELAVEKGLKWLARHQFPDGSWRLNFRDGTCDGQCRNPGTREVTTAATGLTLMAFLGAGYTHRDGPYQKEVQDGLDYLKSRMRKTVYGGNLTEGTMYAQGMAVIALSEAYIMTQDESLARNDRIGDAIHRHGPTSIKAAGDTCLRSPAIRPLPAGKSWHSRVAAWPAFDVPEQTVRTGTQVSLTPLATTAMDFSATRPSSKDPTSTAIGLLVQMFLGWDTEHRGMFAGTKYLKKLGPSKNNIYFNYYATLTLFHSRHSGWDEWNKEMRDYLIQNSVGQRA